MELITQLAARFAEEQGAYRLLVRYLYQQPKEADERRRSSTPSSLFSGTFSLLPASTSQT